MTLRVPWTGCLTVHDSAGLSGVLQSGILTLSTVSENITGGARNNMHASINIEDCT